MSRFTPPNRERVKAALPTVLLLALLACRQASNVKTTLARPVEVSIVDPLFVERADLQREAEAKFTKSTGIKVQSIAGNESSVGLLAQQLELLQSGAPVPDVCYLDNVWAGTLDKYLLDLTPYVPKALTASYIPEILKAYQANGRLIALPQETELPLLYYRADLLHKYGFEAPPQTWDELEQMALKIQTGERRSGNPDFWGYLWEGAASEILTCVGQEYQVSSGGGHILENDGTISLNNRHAAKAFARAARWINWISPPGTVAFQEEDVGNIWEVGNAAFARNWIDANALAPASNSPIRGKVKLAVLPHDPGAASASTVGGWGYGVSRFSRHPREAALLAQALTSRSFQAWQFQHLLVPPAIGDLYSDPAMHEVTLFLQPIKSPLFRSAVPRPSTVAGSHYPEVSRAYARGIHSILTRQATAPEALAALEKELARITGSKVAVHPES